MTTTQRTAFAVIATLILAFELAACGSGATMKAGRTPPPAPAPAPQGQPAAASGDAQAAVVTRSFTVESPTKGGATTDPKSGVTSQEITLVHDYADAHVSFVQIQRPLATNILRQGTPGTAKSQAFRQAEAGLLDIQIVVDNSGSMSEEQAKLKSKLPALLSAISSRNWRINVVTTDPGADPAVLPSPNCSRGIISRGDRNADAAFAAAIDAGIAGSGNERGILMAAEGLKCAAANWVRPHSKVAVLIVSDEDNCGGGKACVGYSYRYAAHLLNVLSNDLGRTLGTQARVYGLIWPEAGADTSCSGSGTHPSIYKTAISQTGGTYGSICDADYTATLQRISNDVAAILTSDFQLTDVPNAGSLQVKVNGVVKTSGFTVQDKVLTFTTPPPEGATIDVTYTTGATPILTRFPLSETPHSGTMSVIVQGLELAPSAYAVDAAAKELVFSVAPANGAEIRASYFYGAPLKRTFDLGGKPEAGSVSVTVGGKPSAFKTVNPNGLVTFDVAPLDGNAIEVAFHADLGPVLKYPVAAPEAELGDVSITEKATGGELGATIEQGQLVIPAALFADGAVVVVSYAAPETAPEADAQPAAAPVPLVFTLDGLTAADAGAWKVEIDGVETQDYTRIGPTVTLKARPHDGAVVTLTFKPGAPAPQS